MEKYKVKDISQWNRKEHYEFFKSFEEPFFGIIAEVDCTKAYQYCKEQQRKFFWHYLHLSLAAMNELEVFRYRIVDDELRCYDAIHGSSTIMREDRTFGFSHLPYAEDFESFETDALVEVERIKASSSLMPLNFYHNVVHYSAIPWLKFTSLSHARKYSIADSCPKVSFAKAEQVNGKLMMPVSIHVHHALVDGIDVGDWFALFQQKLDASI